MSTTRRAKGPEMLAEDLLMLLYHPETGLPLINTHEVDLVLGGALLVELTERQRIQQTDPHPVTKNRTVNVVDPTPTGDDVLDEALQRIAARRSTRSHVIVSRISKGVRGRLLERLAGQGPLRFEKARLVRILPTGAWPAVEVRHTEELRRDLQQVLAGERPPTPRETATICLLHAVRRTAKVLGHKELDRHELKRRAKTIAHGDAASEAVRQALDAAAF